MSNHNDGGPAFPSHGSMGEVAHPGMTLREYFAVHATDEDVKAAMGFGEDFWLLSDRVRARFRYADAMITARESTA